MMSGLTGFKETEIGPIPVDWEAMLLAQAEEERAEADAQFQVLGALGFEGWRHG
jgi:hypothetical protein